MTLYAVYAPRFAADKAAASVFVKEGFCWPAVFIPELWLIYRRMWLVLVLFIVTVIGLPTLAAGIAGADAGIAIFVLLRLWLAMEANGLRRWTLERRGFDLIGVVDGRRRDEAEIRFFAAWPESSEPMAQSPGDAQLPAAIPKPAVDAAPAAAALRPRDTAVGLFPLPEPRR